MLESYEQLKQEYEEFTYIVSHDLNAPLQRLQEFSKLFLEKHINDLSEKDRLYIHFMKGAVVQLEQMQDALLELSQINTKAGPLMEVDCSVLVEQAVHLIVGRGSAQTVKYEALPKVRADQDQLYKVFYHLIDNACKFHENREHGECQITGDDRIDHFMFQIKDNGIGIPDTLHEEVFKIFKRVQEDDTYEGIGAGLAIARKIINRHGGQIWIDSEPEEGTTVVFTLPK